MATSRSTPGGSRRVLRRRILPLLVAAATAALAPPANATTFHWLGGIAPFPTLWSNSFNWTPVGAPSGLSFVDVIEFGGSFGNSVNNIRDRFVLNGIRAFVGAPDGATGTVGGDSLLLSGPSAFIEVGTGGTLTVASTLVEGIEWSKLGAGTLKLTGDNLGYKGTITLAAYGNLPGWFSFTDERQMARAQVALYLVLNSPEFFVQK